MKENVAIKIKRESGATEKDVKKQQEDKAYEDRWVGEGIGGAGGGGEGER